MHLGFFYVTNTHKLRSNKRGCGPAASVAL